MIRAMIASLCLVAVQVEQSIAAEPDSLRPKSRQTATMISAIGTLAPVAVGLAAVAASGNDRGGNAAAGGMGGLLFLTGLWFGPGMGHAYAGDGGRFWRGAGIRFLSTTGAVVMVAVTWDNTPSQAQGALAPFVLCGVITVGSAIYDIATAGRSADGYNRKHGLAGLTARPCYFSSQKAVGVRLTFRF